MNAPQTPAEPSSSPAVAAAPRGIHRGRAGRRFWKQGEPLVWATGGALTVVILMTVILFGVVLVNGLTVFWPHAVSLVKTKDGKKFFGLPTRENTEGTEIQFKSANRELDPSRQDFCWRKKDDINSMSSPPGVLVLERMENGDFFGTLQEIRAAGLEPRAGGFPSDSQGFSAALDAVRAQRTSELGPVLGQLDDLSGQLQAIDSRLLTLTYRRDQSQTSQGGDAVALSAQIAQLEQQKEQIKQDSDRLVSQKQKVESSLRKSLAVMADASGRTKDIALLDVVRVYAPNDMTLGAKIGHYLAKVGELLTADPRESNTEGGLFPAIFGTVMLVFLMSIFCFPLGVVAGVYLGEYAREGFLVRLVRIGVNNLAGIPSIVYGIFGLGFFVYVVGSSIDHVFFPEWAAQNTPVFGTGGILWASLTLGLLTIPVVIVSTEEALRTIPRGIREGSYALGATKYQTLVRVLVPMASPGMMTGFILAMARAAGEVAPLMITGVIKIAPSMPLDSQFPYFHVDRKFMHLGFHIFDIGFQSPNAEASKPMVYVTTLLLLLIVLSLSSVAIYLRNRMRKRYLLKTI